MTRDLKLMVDYNIKHATSALDEIGSANAKSIIEYGLKQHSHDPEIIAKSTAEKCILITNDYRSIDEARFPPCSHGGIILIKDQQPSPETIKSLVQSLAQCGHGASISLRL